MSNVKIITERISSLSYKFAKENNIHVFPANIVYKNKIIKDDCDEKSNKFLSKLDTFDEIPSTAIPSFGELKKELEKATRDTNKAIYITTSHKLSSMHSLAVKTAKYLNKKGKDIRIFDSYTTVSMEGMYAYYAAKLSYNNLDIDKIINSLEKIKDEKRIVEYGVIQTLKYLEKNGRIGKAKAWLGNILSFKPLITAKNGVLEPISKTRTNKKGLDIIVNYLKEDIERTKAKKIKIMYDYGISDQYIKETVNPRIKKEFNPEIISFNQISTVIACHLGIDVWGVCALLE